MPLMLVVAASSLSLQTRRAEATLFRDHVTESPTDPCIFYNYNEQAW